MTRGIVSAGSPHAAEAGAEMFRRGGNAVDAAAAAAFTSYVSETAISTLGGGGFGLLKKPSGDPVLYDFFVTVPGRGGTGGLPENLDFAPIPMAFESATHIFHAGRGSSGVPGNVAGLCAMVADAGRLPLQTILDPAIRLARDGYEVTPIQAYSAGIVSPILGYDESSRRYFITPDGRLIQSGDRFANPELSRSLEIIAQEGADAFYRGALAEEIVKDHALNGGLITAEDLASYEVIRREPLEFAYRDVMVVTNPPPSTGGILVGHSLRLLQRVDLRQMEWGGLRHCVLMTEVARETAEARLRDAPHGLPDPEAWRDWLTDRNIDAAWKSVSKALDGNPGGWSRPEPKSTPSTTHVSTADADGYAASISTTPGETGGYTVGETGILMNNVLGEEDVNPDGFHKHPPGTRLPSMMSPSLVVRSGRPEIVVGTGGSARIRTAIVQVINNLIDWGLSLEDAVDRPRVHWEDGVLHLEGGIDTVVADRLEARGYDVKRWNGRSMYFGGAHVAFHPPDGSLQGAGDPRRGGTTIIVEGGEGSGGRPAES